MKKVDLCDIMDMLKSKGIDLNEGNTLMNDYENEHGYTIEEFDKVKTKLLKYITYKKRTENEVRTKFAKDIESNILEDAIEELKALGYISDVNYIDRAVNEFIALKNLSMRELKYKLLSKGIKSSIIEDYFSDYYNELVDYEMKSAQNIYNKKIKSMEEQDIKSYLIKKGYREDSIREILERN